jgi:hypothetical protein
MSDTRQLNKNQSNQSQFYSRDVRAADGHVAFGLVGIQSTSWVRIPAWPSVNGQFVPLSVCPTFGIFNGVVRHIKYKVDPTAN